MASAATLAATDQERDLDRLTAEIAHRAQPPGPQNAEEATRLASLRTNRASLSGDLGELRRAGAALDEAIGRFGPWPDLCYLRASLHLKQHRLVEAVGALARGDGLPESPDGRAVRADADLQMGRYGEVRVRLRAAGRRDAVVGQPGPARPLRGPLRRRGAGRRALRARGRRDHGQGAALLCLDRSPPRPAAPAPRARRRGRASLRAGGPGLLRPLARRAPPGRGARGTGPDRGGRGTHGGRRRAHRPARAGPRGR